MKKNHPVEEQVLCNNLDDSTIKNARCHKLFVACVNVRKSKCQAVHCKIAVSVCTITAIRDSV